MGQFPLGGRFAIAIPLLIAAWCLSASADEEPRLEVVDRSMNKDGLYHCVVSIPKGVPADTVGVVLYDRQKKKMGLLMLDVFDTFPDESVAPFWLSHELIKHSVVTIGIYPLNDDRHRQITYVIGERSAVRKQDGTRTEVPIE
jgi:hypothetical protein